MKKTKAFDAVEMKNAIQRKHRTDRAGMSCERERQTIVSRLAESNTRLARQWRRLKQDGRHKSRAVGQA